MKRMIFDLGGRLLLIGFVAPLVMCLVVQDRERGAEEQEKLLAERVHVREIIAGLETVDLTEEQEAELAMVFLHTQTRPLANLELMAASTISIAGVVVGLLGLSALLWARVLALETRLTEQEDSQQGQFT